MGLIKSHDEQQKDTPITQEILRILGELGTKTKVFIVPHTPFLQHSNFQNSTLYIQPSTSMKLPLKLLLQCNSGVSSQRQGSVLAGPVFSESDQRAAGGRPMVVGRGQGAVMPAQPWAPSPLPSVPEKH